MDDQYVYGSVDEEIEPDLVIDDGDDYNSDDEDSIKVCYT